jgi:phenylacetic acid degradation operon negative regulatory protein
MNAPNPTMAPLHPALTVLTGRLHAQGRLRVWSIVITIFGDAIAPRGGVAALADILTITAAMGIEGGAVRTAMSRLAKEGWVERRREGRTSHYALTPHGEDTFLAATRRIYSPTFATPVETARLVITEGEAPGLPLRPSVGLLLDQPAPPDALSTVIDLADAPEWVRRAVLSDSLASDYQSLADDFEKARQTHANAPPLDALALRILAIHFWRRLVLRHPAPPAPLTPNDWPGVRCHAALANLYADILTPSEAWWGTPAPSHEQTSKRF